MAIQISLAVKAECVIQSFIFPLIKIRNFCIRLLLLVFFGAFYDLVS